MITTCESKTESKTIEKPPRLLCDDVTGEPFRNVCVFRALQLGDLLCSVPAFRSLRAALPNARLTLIGLPWAEEFCELYSDLFDSFIAFPGHPGLPERDFDGRLFRSFVESVQSRSFDLILQMHGSGSVTNPLVATFSARTYAGFRNSTSFCPDPDRFTSYPDGIHEVWRHLRLMQHLEVPIVTDEIDIRLHEWDHHELEREIKAPIDRPFVCLHPGAREDFRRWSPENYAAVGDRLAKEGFEVFVTGTSSEYDLATKVVDEMKMPAHNLAGRTSLRSLSALLSRSRLLVCNDTGVSHLAVALRRPSVVVFTRSEFLGWPPLNRNLHRVVSRFFGPQPEDVLNEARDLLSLSDQPERLPHA